VSDETRSERTYLATAVQCDRFFESVDHETATQWCAVDWEQRSEDRSCQGCLAGRGAPGWRLDLDSLREVGTDVRLLCASEGRGGLGEYLTCYLPAFHEGDHSDGRDGYVWTDADALGGGAP
jgi:hypothetical protein